MAKAILIEYNGKKQSISAWARELGIKQQTLNNRIVNLGMSIEKAFTTYNYNHDRRTPKSDIKHDFFKNGVCDELTAYFLGFIMGDGNIYRSKTGYKNRISLKLKSTDYKHVQLFADIFGSKNKIVIKSSFRKLTLCKYANCELNSSELCDDLEKLGCGPCKSLTLKFPEYMNNNIYFKHFLRGIFDSDGSIGIYKKRNSIGPSFTLAGTQDFLLGIREFLIKNLGVTYNCNVKKNGKNCWSLCYTNKKDVLLLKNYLYNDATVYLKRKYDIFMKVK